MGVIVGGMIYPIAAYQEPGEAAGLIVMLVEQMAARGLISREMANKIAAATRGD
jgi:hypothetical protein